MKVAVGLLTFNQYKTGRAQMFRDCVQSLMLGEHSYRLTVVTNGSTDGTDRVVFDMGGIVDNSNPAIWYGMQLAIDACMDHKPDLVVFTADDYRYEAGWLRRLVNFWEQAPDDVKLATGNIEPRYPWNSIRGTVAAGEEVALVRDSVPGANWTFRARDWKLIGPIPHYTPREDLDTCAKLTGQGYRLAALDLCEHVGANQSAWGNAVHDTGQPVDKQHWGLT